MKRKLSAIILIGALIFATNGICGDVSALKVLKDINGTPAIGLTATGKIDAIVLVANTAQSYTIPSGARFLLFSGTNNFYVNIGGGTATVPSATTSSGAASMLNPTLRSIGASTTVSLIAPTAAVVTIESFK